MRSERTNTLFVQSVILVAYYAVLVAFLVASFSPKYRVWGINWWAYFPGYVPFVLFAIGAVAPIVIRLVLRRGESDADDDRASADGSRKYFIIVFCLTVFYALVFYLLRARAHFLGDGYAALVSVASDTILVKPRGLGEVLFHIWVKSAVGGDAKTATLFSFQAISISTGILLLVAAAISAGALFERTKDRILLLLGLASSGYMLLSFGYVEFYSLFVLTVAAYTLMGLLVIRGKINRWLILPVVAVAAVFHVMGVTLIPSAIYLLVANSKFGNALAGLNRKTKLLMGAITVVILVLIFYHYYSTDYFFRFAFVPLLENRFTAEGYTLFSSKHLLDYFNLLILLLPGLPLVVAVLLFLPVGKILQQREYRYLLILLASTFGATFVFDPKMGMPRDWDLFSFSGVPLVIFSYYLILDNRRLIPPYTTVSALAILLGVLSLLPRAVSEVVPEISVAHFRDYSELDKVKNRTARRILIDFYKEAGNEEMARLETQRAFTDFPERQLVDSAVVFVNTGRPLEAVPLLHRVLDVNALYADAWVGLGRCYLLLQMNDSAAYFLEVANGLNPYNAVLLCDLGTAHLLAGAYEKAEKILKQSRSFAPSRLEPLVNLVRLYALWGHWEKYHGYLTELSLRPDAPFEPLKQFGDYHLSKRDFRKATEAYRIALQKGLDSTYVNQLVETYPQLLEYLSRQTESPGSPVNPR